MENDLVSIITPLHESEDFIKETVESVLAQSYTKWEMIIVDDCSKDEGASLVKSFMAKDARIKYLKNKTNSGPAVTRNTAIEAANGRFIAFLDSDDVWYPEKLESQLKFMEDHGACLSFTAYHKITEKGEVIGKRDVPPEVSYRDLLKTCSIGCLTAMYDRKRIGTVYMPLIRKRQDFALWLKILKLTPKAHGLNRTLAGYRVRTKSISSNKFNAAKYQWRVYRDIEHLSVVSSIYYFIHYFIYGTINTYFE